jgi:hypothetical protein
MTSQLAKAILDRYDCHGGKLIITRTPLGRMKVELVLSRMPGVRGKFVKAWSEEATVEGSIECIYDALFDRRPGVKP